MRLIDVDAAIDCIKSGIKEDGNFESDAIHLIEFLNVFARSNKVTAVPLDKLCEWLGNLANPCNIGIRCYYPDDNDHDCMPTVECWRYVLTKWMEEQNA